MNTRHLGDANDLAKKDILKTLKTGLSEKIYVVPMFSDVFNEEQLAFYKFITHADEIKTKKFEHSKRKEYLAQLPNEHFGIIFIDPDIGIKDKFKEGKKSFYVHYDEIMLFATSDNLLVVYDESFDNGKDKETAIRDKIEVFKNRNCYACYINFNRQLTFALISQSEKRLEDSKCLLIDEKVILPSRFVHQVK
jgi:hypothetical protein